VEGNNMAEVDSYKPTINLDQAIQAKHPSSTSYSSVRGQTFRSSNSYLLTSAKFQLKRTSSAPDGTIKAYLYAHTGTFGSGGLPTGEVLATSTNSVNAGDLTTSYVQYTFTFDGTYTLEANTAYCIMLYSLDCTNWGGSIYPRVAGNDTGADDGNGFRYRSSEWQALTTYDNWFEVNGDGPLLDVDSEMNMFPDNVVVATTAAAIETWLDGLSITTLRKLHIEHKGGFYRSIAVYE